MALSSPARSEETLLLRYRAPTSCPKASVLRQNVDALLKDPEAVPGNVPVEVVVDEQSDGSYSLDLQLPNGNRQLDGAICDDVVEAAALFVALLLEDPEYTQEEPEPIEQEQEQDVPPSPQPTPSRRPRFYAGVSAGIDASTMPQPGPLAALHFGLVGQPLVIEGRALFSFPQQNDVTQRRTLETTVLGGSLRGCHVPSHFPLGFFTLCGGISAGALFASSPEILTAGEAAPAFLNADLGGAFWFLIEDSFALTLGGELSQPLLAPAIYVRGGDEPVLVHKATTTFRGLAGMRLIF